MRFTFSQLIQAAQDYTIDDQTISSSGLTDPKTFLKRELNSAVKDVFTLMRKYNLRPLPKTASTVAGQIWYHNPPGLSKIETITVPVGNIVLPLRVVQSQDEWDQLHIVPITSNYPEAVYPRRDDFGIFPTPQTAVTMTLTGNYQPLNMHADDYSDGTVTVANNSQTVTGTGTFTSDMVGRYFFITDSDGLPISNWYRVNSYVSSSVITLETFFQDTSVTGASYIIGESPDIPEELHEFLSFRAAGVYYSAHRRDLEQGARMMNYYYTGDFSNPNRKGNIRGGVLAVLKDLQEKGHGNSQITEMANAQRPPILAGGIWSTVISPAS